MLPYSMIIYSDRIADRLRVLRDLGVPIAKIARTWKVSRQTIYNWIERDKLNKSLTDV